MLGFPRGEQGDEKTPARSAHRRLAVWAVGAGLLAVGLVPFLAVAQLLYDRQVQAASVELQNLAYIVAHETASAIRGADAALANVVARLRASDPQSVRALDSSAEDVRTRSQIDAAMSGNPLLASVSIIDADGGVDSGSRQGVLPPELIRSSGYLNALKAATPGSLVVATPFFADTAGSWMIALSRPVFSSEGAFLGAVAAVLRLSAIDDLFTEIDLGPQGSVSIFARDGALVAWAPKTQTPFGSSIAGSELHRRFVAPRSEGVAQQDGDVDGVRRLYAVKIAGDYGLSVVAAKGMPDVLAGWYGQMRILAGVAVLAVVLVALSTFGLARRSDRKFRQRAARQLEHGMAQQARMLSNAINNVTQGIAMFDKDGVLIVWNARYAQMFGFPEGFLRPGLNRADLVACKDAQGFGSPIDRPAPQADGSALTHSKLADGRIIAQRKTDLPEGGFVSSQEDVTERLAAQERIQRMATRDNLTELLNRFSFRELLENALGEVRRGGAKCAVFYIDLDHFKQINDTLGHSAGDELLKQAAGRLRSAVRKGDAVSRLGGDEFAIVQRAAVLPRDAEKLAQRIIAAISQPYEIAGRRVTVGASIGISVTPGDSLEADQIVRNADLALYRSKQAGRGVYSFFDPGMDERVRERHALEEDLRAAIAGQEFELVYQPLVAFADGAVQSFEALIRWRHPTRGVVGPNAFIPVAEETGLIVAIGEWVLRTACQHAKRLPPAIKIGVNVSPAQFRSAGFLGSVRAAIDAAGIAPSRLIVEITEGVMVKDIVEAGATVDALRKLGVVVAMDDFGTGYSSLLYLHKLHFDKVKIDRSFVSNLGADPSAEAIVRAIVALARALRLTTVAEGVETQAQFDRLAEIGCAEAQGYLLSRPMPADDTLAYVAANGGLEHEASPGHLAPIVNGRTEAALAPVVPFARAS